MKKQLGLAILLLTSSTIPCMAQSPEPTPTYEPREEAFRSAITHVIESNRAEQETGLIYFSFFPPALSIESINFGAEETEIVFNRRLGYRPWSREEIKDLRALLESELKAIGETNPLRILIEYGDKSESLIVPIEQQVSDPQSIRERAAKRTYRHKVAAPVVSHVDYPGPDRSLGLEGRHIVVGPSHGYTWHKENRWQYQRARVYTIIEDLFPLHYINTFIAPMIENAGGVVFSTRERDYNRTEVIVDNEGTTPLSEFQSTGDWTPKGQGWFGGRVPYLSIDDLPFTKGNSASASIGSGATSTYVPYIPHDGKFAVTMSWSMDEKNSPSVPVTIKHLGGTTTVNVNQQIAGNTWVFLGFFPFAMGADAEHGSVRIDADNASTEGGATTVSIDAVRFGGGMGNVATGDMISGKPRISEASMYYVQYLGAPKEVSRPNVGSPEHFGMDYWYDISSRGEWTNYLAGAPYGPNHDRTIEGLGIPIDMFLSFHTDAGFDEERLIGTLSLYRLWGSDGEDRFPDGRSRWLNRDLTSLMQDEIVRTAQSKYSSSWVRRAVQERNLGEARRPNVPSTLLELVSHHNFNDMKYGVDPRYQFDMSRAIYKSVVRFLAYQDGIEPIIQPLPPRHVAARHLGSGRVEVSFLGTPDPLEPSANADGFIIYQSADGIAFDNGVYTTDSSMVIEGVPENDTVYFKVTAANQGGQSMPSPVVGVRWSASGNPALIVDGFERISGPKIIHNERTHGFDRATDPGVPYLYNYALVGEQYDFDPKSEWQNDLEWPGMGGSNMEWEDRLEKGNTFDHIVLHGEAFAAADVNFDSMTNTAFDGNWDGVYTLIDWIGGLQKTEMPYEGIPGAGNPDQMEPEFPLLTSKAVNRLNVHLDAGGKLILSGSYIAEELLDNHFATSSSASFAKNRLGIESYESDATAINFVQFTPDHALPEATPFRFGRDLDSVINIEPTVYRVPSAEAYRQADGAAMTLGQYGDNLGSIGVLTSNTATIGFPLETIMPMELRHAFMKELLEKLRE